MNDLRDAIQHVERATGPATLPPDSFDRLVALRDRRQRDRRIRALTVAAVVILLAGIAVGAIRVLGRGERPRPAQPSPSVDAFSELRGKIVYTDASGTGQVEAIDPSDAGATPTPIPFLSGWSPIARSGDGERLLAVRNGHDLGVVNADGSSELLLRGATTDLIDKSFSPDGTSVAYVGQRGIESIQVGTHDVSTVLRDTQPHREAMFGAAWSPDGSAIAFIDRRWLGHGRTRYTIQTVRPDGSDRRVLRVLASRAYEIIEGPTWSPDGSRLCFVLGFGDKNDGAIFVMDADGGNLQRLTGLRRISWFPTWSPDGTQIAYVGSDDLNTAHARLMIMSADGSNPRQIGPFGWVLTWMAPAHTSTRSP